MGEGHKHDTHKNIYVNALVQNAQMSNGGHAMTRFRRFRW